MNKSILSVFLAIFILAGPSCGYRFEGGGYLKESVRRVAVSIFENRTNESGAGFTFANALIQEITEKTDTRVVDPEMAEAVIKGTITAITFSTLSRSTSESVVEREVTAILDVKMVDSSGEILWSIKKLVSTDDYKVAEDQLSDDANKRSAVEQIASRCAEKIVSRLLINF